MPDATAPLDSAPDVAPREHLVSIDIARGVLALLVVVHHAWMNVLIQTTHTWAPVQLRPLEYGDFPVAAFLAVSGYSLALRLFPVSRWRGIREYAARRARRIYPPYLAALAVSVLLGATVLATKTGSHWDNALPFGPLDVAAHLLLIHNVQREWIFKINYPLWSIATEAQVYVLLPLVVWIGARRPALALAVPLLISALALLIVWPVPGQTVLDAIRNATGFTFGRCGLYFLVGVLWRKWETRFRVPPVAWSLLGWAMVLAAFGIARLNYESDAALLSGLVAAGMGAILAGASKVPKAPGPLVRLLAPFGLFSYSLYLVHAPLVELVWRFGGSAWVGHEWKRGVLYVAVATVAAVVGSYGFFLVAERPFLRSRSSG